MSATNVIDQIWPTAQALRPLALALSRDASIADELVSATCLRALEKHLTFSGDNLRAWMATIMRRLRIDMIRRAQRMEYVDAVDIDRAQMWTDDPDEVLDAAGIVDAVERLEGSRAEVMAMRIDGMAYAEIADAVAKPIGTVMSTIHRARQQVIEEIDASKRGRKRRQLLAHCDGLHCEAGEAQLEMWSGM